MSMSAPPSTPPISSGKLPFWRTLVDAHRSMFYAGAGFWRYAAAWLLVLLVLDTTINWLAWPYQDDAPAHMSTWSFYLLASALLWIVIGGIVGVPLHRQLLSDRITLVGAAPSSAGARIYRLYIARNIAIAAFAFLPIFAVVFLGGAFVDASAAAIAESAPAAGDDAIGALAAASDTVASASDLVMMFGALMLALVLLSYFPTRFSLALPATAIDSGNQTFKFAWHASRGHFWRLFWGGLLSFWPLLIVGVIEFAVTGLETESQAQYVFCQAIDSAVNFLTSLIWVAFFSLAYRRLVPQLHQNICEAE